MHPRAPYARTSVARFHLALVHPRNRKRPWRAQVRHSFAPFWRIVGIGRGQCAHQCFVSFHSELSRAPKRFQRVDSCARPGTRRSWSDTPAVATIIDPPCSDEKWTMLGDIAYGTLALTTSLFRLVPYRRRTLGQGSAPRGRGPSRRIPMRHLIWSLSSCLGLTTATS